MKPILLTAASIALCTVAASAEPIARDVGTGPLLFTGQILPTDGKGKVYSANDPGVQTVYLLEKTQAILADSGVRISSAARIHFYAASPEAESAARAAVEKKLPGIPQTWVITPLSHPDASVALDLVVPAGETAPRSPTIATLSPGVRYFVSGQAAREKALNAATRKTMEQLAETLEQYGRSLDDAVQIKSFLRPMSDVEVARKEIASFFSGKVVPPLVFVEWDSSLPIEIELVAGGGEAADGSEALDYLTPEGMKASPVYRRVVRVNDAPLVYASGLDGSAELSAPDQVREVFGALESVLGKNGSDLRHLVKGTYYVAEDGVSKALNELRPEYYDPERPPSASKAKVAGGGGGGVLTVDMIAVGKEP